MTWNVQFSGESKQGPNTDPTQQHEYLKRVFNDAMLKIKSEGIITLSTARLTTDNSQYDFVSQKESSAVTSGVKSVQGNQTS